MNLFLMLLGINFVLALAVVGIIGIRRTETGICVNFETAIVARWLRSLRHGDRDSISDQPSPKRSTPPGRKRLARP